MSNQLIIDKAYQLTHSLAGYESLLEWLSVTEQFASDEINNGQFTIWRMQYVTSFLTMFHSALREKLERDKKIINDIHSLIREEELTDNS